MYKKVLYLEENKNDFDILYILCIAKLLSYYLCIFYFINRILLIEFFTIKLMGEIISIIELGF